MYYVAAWLVAGVVLSSPGPATTMSPKPTETLSPNEIYARSVREMRLLSARAKPKYVVYDLDVASHNLRWFPVTNSLGLTEWATKLVHANETHAFRVWYRSKDQRALVQDRVTHQLYKGDAFFEPEVANFMTAPTPTPSPSPSAASSAPGVGSDFRNGSNKVIGAVTVDGSRNYAVTLVGAESLDGHSVAHLHLRAFRDPEDYPLTDLWVDAVDYRVWAAHGEVTIRAVAAGLGVGVDARFAPVGDAWLITGLDFTARGYVALWHVNVGAKMQSDVILVPASLPDAYFEP